jgi:hypothetical protein
MAVTSHQTRWTLIPRGVDANTQTMQFTVVVSPTMYSTGNADNIPDSTALEQTVWAGWYRTIADLIKSVDAGSTPLFLSLQSDLGNQPLALKLQGQPDTTKRHPNSSSADDATWASLWSDLTRTFPDHLETDGPSDSTVLTTSYATPSGTFSSARSFSLLAETIAKIPILGFRSPAQHTAVVGADVPNKAKALNRFTVENSNKSVSDVARLATTQHLEDARLYARADSDAEKTLRADLTKEIQTWVDSVNQPTNDDQKLQHRHAKQAIRNLHRLSRVPFVELKLEAMLYVYEKQRKGLSGFTPNAEFDDLRKKLSAQRMSFIDIAVFHRRAKYKRKAQQVRRTTPIGGACLQYGDFLKVLNTLGHYPQVLYGLGLAFDVVATEKADWSKAKRMWVEVDPNTARTLNADTSQPRTAVSFAAGDLSQGPYPADFGDSGSDHAIQGGYLSLDGCTVIDYDSDAIGLGTIQQADNTPTQVLDGAGGALAPPAGSTPPDTLPMKSGGLTILPPGLVQVMQSRLSTQTGNRDKSGDQLVFTSTDLVRGFAPQVVWRNRTFSLTARIDAYDYRQTDGSTKQLLSAEEVDTHPIQLEAAYARDYAEDAQQTQPSTDLHIAPSLLRWNGWSQLVKSPFDAAESANTQTTTCVPAPKFPVKPSYLPPRKVENKLPSLRFGETYTFQIRAIDIAGNPIASQPTTKPSAVGSQYLRHDPISAPALLVEDSFDPVASPGEQIDVMVARIEDPDHQPLRYLCPQTCDLHALIWQGALDDSDGKLRPPIDTPSRDGVGSFDDVRLEANGNFPTKIVPQGAAAGAKGTYTVPVYEYPNDDVASGAYLPDSYARNVCFRLVDVATGAVYPLDPISFYRADSLPDDDPTRPDFEWPRAEHVQVQLNTFDDKEPTLHTMRKSWNAAQPDRINTRLEIDVPTGWQMELQVSCAPTEDQAKTMAPIALAQQENIDAFRNCLSSSGVGMPQVGPSDVTKLLLQGMSDLYTPYRPLGLVAAVKRPRRESYILEETLQVLPQLPDSSLATFTATIHVQDGRATGMLDVYLMWWEYTDDPTKAAPSKKQIVQHLGQYPNVAINKLSQWQPDDDGYIANDLTFGPNPDHPHPTQSAKTTFKFPAARHRQVEVRVDSVSRFVSYYNSDPNTSTAGFTLPGTTLATVSVKNTTRPDALIVTRIKPLFPSIAGRTAQHSFGGAMRIHFARGIYSAGEGPRIGVVVADNDDKPACGNDSWQTDPAKAGLYTRWGLDPARDATGLGENTNSQGFTPAPKETHFTPPQKLAGFDSPVAKTVQLAELPSPSAKILTYEPVFTPEDGWYCDIILNQIPAYNCFLRLALVLYQEQSLEQKMVSTVSLAAFVQLRADRSMTLLPTQAKHQLVLMIDGTRPGLDVGGKTTSFTVSVEIHDRGVWITDPDTTLCAVSATCPAPPLQGGGPDVAGAPLAEYVLTVAKHHCRKRRLRVEEFESRLTYDPVTLADIIGPPALVYAMEPMILPHM